MRGFFFVLCFLSILSFSESNVCYPHDTSIFAIHNQNEKSAFFPIQKITPAYSIWVLADLYSKSEPNLTAISIQKISPCMTEEIAYIQMDAEEIILPTNAISISAEGHFRPVSDLKVGDGLVNSKGLTQTVTSIKIKKSNQKGFSMAFANINGETPPIFIANEVFISQY